MPELRLVAGIMSFEEMLGSATCSIGDVIYSGIPVLYHPLYFFWNEARQVPLNDDFSWGRRIASAALAANELLY